MATYAWNGSTGSYFDPSNWSPAGVPGRGDTALLGAGNVTFSRFGNEAFTGGEIFLLSGSAILSLSLSPFAVLNGDTFVLPADAASAATTKLVNNNGFVNVDRGTLVVSVPVEGSGSFSVGAGTLEFGNSVGAGTYVTAYGSEAVTGRPHPPHSTAGDSVLKLDRPAAFEGVVTQYFGSTMDLVGVAIDSVAFAPSTRPDANAGETVMRLLDGGATVASLRLSGATPIGVSVAPDGAGGTLVRPDFEPNPGYPGGLKVPGPYSRYSVDIKAGATVVSDAALTEYVNPGTTLDFTDGLLSFGTYDPGSDLYRLYEAALGRAPDSAGNLYWSGVLRNYGYYEGVKLVAGGFLQSDEYGERQAAEPTDAEFVARLYRDALGRAPDAVGESYWVGNLGSDQSRGDVLAYFTLSPEAGRHSAAGIAATGVFSPDPSPWV